jgi:hypothetical protein
MLKHDNAHIVRDGLNREIYLHPNLFSTFGIFW